MITNQTAVAGSASTGLVGRSPLAEGRAYSYPGYPGAGFRVRTVRMPGHPGHDGGWPGVAVEFIGHRPLGRRLLRAWFTAASESEFWAKPIFANAVDAPNSLDQQRDTTPTLLDGVNDGSRP
jgi:hypothetical protein